MRRIIFAVITVLTAMIMVSGAVYADDEIVSNIQSMWGTDWSPDGNTIAFGSKGDLFLADVATGEVTCLTEHTDIPCHYPIFSHDGTELYFSCFPTVTQAEKPTNEDWEQGETRIINIETGDIRPFIQLTYLTELSPDGKYAVYNKNLSSHAVFNIETGEEKVFELDVNDGPPFYEISMATFSPDNSYFIATYYALFEPRWLDMNKAYRFYKVFIDSGEKEELNVNNLPSWYPKISPDGSKLLLSQIDHLARTTRVDEDTVMQGHSGKEYKVVEWYASEEANTWIKDPDTGEWVHPNMENYWSRDEEQEVYYKSGDQYIWTAIHPKEVEIGEPQYNVVLYDLVTEEVLLTLGNGMLETKMASWSPDGSQFCYIKYDREYISSLFIYDLTQGANKMLVDGSTYEPDPTSVESEAAPAPFSITGNYPNPFNPTTTIEFTLEKAGSVSLDIFNVMGQKVRSLESSVMAPGAHSVVWNGRDESGSLVSSGVYLCRLKMGESLQSKAMLLAK